MKTTLLCLILSFALSGSVSAQDKLSYMPNPTLTPGDALDLTKVDLCGPKKANLEDRIGITVKSQVFDRYDMSPYAVGLNVDHLIPIGLGGSNSLKNLWPQPLAGEWSYNRKNQLERKLHKMVCSGEIELRTARQEIAADWVSAYKKYMGESGQTRR